LECFVGEAADWVHDRKGGLSSGRNANVADSALKAVLRNARSSSSNNASPAP